MTTVAITMAGRGQRFRDAGYDVPKYEIEVRGRTVFDWALASIESWLRGGAHVVLVARREDAPAAFLAAACPRAGIRSHDLVELDGVTDGQATTALLAGPAVRDPHEPFLVYNIDTHVRPGAMRMEDACGDGWIPVFPGEGSAWSFAAVGADGRVCEVREKVRISPHATVGLYWFASFDAYARLYERHFGADGAGDAAGERYIAPMYNTLIAAGGDVRVAQLALADVVPLGTPAELRQFAAAG